MMLALKNLILRAPRYAAHSLLLLAVFLLFPSGASAWFISSWASPVDGGTYFTNTAIPVTGTIDASLSSTSFSCPNYSGYAGLLYQVDGGPYQDVGGRIQYSTDPINFSFNVGPLPAGSHSVELYIFTTNTIQYCLDNTYTPRTFTVTAPPSPPVVSLTLNGAAQDISVAGDTAFTLQATGTNNPTSCYLSTYGASTAVWSSWASYPCSDYSSGKLVYPSTFGFSQGDNAISIYMSNAGGDSSQVTRHVAVTAALPTQLPIPEVSPSGGVFTSPVSVSILPHTPPAGQEIHYTLDGTIPTETSPLYTGPFTLSSSAQVMARSYETGYTPSLWDSKTFNIGTPTLTAPSLSTDVCSYVPNDFFHWDARPKLTWKYTPRDVAYAIYRCGGADCSQFSQIATIPAGQLLFQLSSFIPLQSQSPVSYTITPNDVLSFRDINAAIYPLLAPPRTYKYRIATIGSDPSIFSSYSNVVVADQNSPCKLSLPQWSIAPLKNKN